MKILGIDFTSTPSKRKPITAAKCLLLEGTLKFIDIEEMWDWTHFEACLGADGPWIAGLDFPFGQPRKLILNLDLPLIWSEYVTEIGKLSRKDFELTLNEYRKDRPKGDKQHMRTIDQKAKSCSPMMLYGVPVAKMFFEGAPRLERSDANIIPNRLCESDKTIVEAYPALVARKFIGKQSYKNDIKSKQTQEHANARGVIVQGLRSRKLVDIYGFKVDIDNINEKQLIEEPTADSLDAILCAVQAGWAFLQKDHNYGIPQEVDSLEGWIADPEIK